MRAFDQTTLLRLLDQLSPARRCAFASACAERLMPGYVAFSRSTSSGAPELIAQLMDRVWSRLIEGERKGVDWGAQLAEVMNVIPSEDDEAWVPEQVAGSDAASALAYCLRCLISGESQEALWAATCVRDFLDYRIVNEHGVDIASTASSREVDSHPEMQAEFERQERDLVDLCSKEPDAVVVNRIMMRAKADAHALFP